MSILASRNHTCINNMVKNQPDAIELCQSLIDKRKGDGCSFYHKGIQSITHEGMQQFRLPVVYDIEDMVVVGKKKRMCPYYSLRELADKSQIIFCPYNYLIDPVIRKQMNIDINKSIVIMDEAHNIEDICRETGSLKMKQLNLQEAIKDCRHNINRSIHLFEYKEIEGFLQLLDTWLDRNGPKSQYSADNESSSAITGQELLNRLHVEGITEEIFQSFLESQKRIEENIKDDPDLLPISSVVKQICTPINTIFGYLFKSKNVEKYKAYFCREIGPKSSTPNTWLSKHKTNEERVWKYAVHILCLSPSIVFSELLQARTIILASGTLSPLASFQSELAVDFPHVVKGRHVISPENLFVTVVPAGPNGESLKGVFTNTNTYSYQDELGRIIVETSRVVPHGVLCFFQSYYLMEKLKERWSDTGLLNQLKELKEVFWEPRRKEDMASTMQEFTLTIEKSSMLPNKEIGAIMFGVYRGKIAEGIDFNDDNARAVIAVGIPYLNARTMEISLKMKFNDENVKNNLMSGRNWYSTQAYRALNQSLGRCIRHKNDWGAIILLDSRFTSKYIQDQLPGWIQQKIEHQSSWDMFIRNLSVFCERMKKNS